MLREQLGASHTAYTALLAAHTDLRPEWKWYGQKNGWSLKLLDHKRNIAFVAPLDGRFKVAFTLGQDQVNQALHSDLPEDARHRITEAPVYPEGRGVSFEVEREDQLAPVHTLIRIKRGDASHAPGGPRHQRNRAATRPQAPPAPPPGSVRPPISPAHRRGRSPG
jgi:hypothetical protein